METRPKPKTLLAAERPLPELSASSDEQFASQDAPPLTFAEYDAALVKEIALGVGNHRQASFHLDSARRQERQASQYRMQIAAIRAVAGPRPGVRLSHLNQAMRTLEKAALAHLRAAEIALSMEP